MLWHGYKSGLDRLRIGDGNIWGWVDLVNKYDGYDWISLPLMPVSNMDKIDRYGIYLRPWQSIRLLDSIQWLTPYGNIWLFSDVGLQGDSLWSRCIMPLCLWQWLPYNWDNIGCVLGHIKDMGLNMLMVRYSRRLQEVLAPISRSCTMSGKVGEHKRGIPWPCIPG